MLLVRHPRAYTIVYYTNACCAVGVQGVPSFAVAVCFSVVFDTVVVTTLCCAEARSVCVVELEI